MTKKSVLTPERTITACVFIFLVVQILLISFHPEKLIVLKANVTIFRHYRTEMKQTYTEAGLQEQRNTTDGEIQIIRRIIKGEFVRPMSYTEITEDPIKYEKLYRGQYLFGMKEDSLDVSNMEHTDQALYRPRDIRIKNNLHSFKLQHVSKQVYGKIGCGINNRKGTIIISSAINHLKQRMAIRKTWGSLCVINQVECVFNIGINELDKLDERVAEESSEYGDIIVGNFRDSYHNLTLKTLFGFQWALKNCPYMNYLMKTDDDVYLNVPNLVEFINSNGSHLSQGIAGFCLESETPNRNQSSKWFVSTREYPHELYPPFCSGIGYVTSRYAVQQVLQIIHHTDYIHLEDVFIGVCLRKLGYQTFDISGFYQRRLPAIPCFYKGSDVIVVHDIKPDLLRKIWLTDCDRSFLNSDRYKNLLSKIRQSNSLV